MRARWFLPAVAGLALALGAAACQRPDPNDGIATVAGAAPSTSAPGAAAPSGEYDPVKWAQCMRQHGIPTDDPVPGVEEGFPGGKPHIHEGTDPEAIREAADQCRQFNPDFGRPAPPMSPEELDQQRKWARCMRANGVNIPDPQPGTDDSRAIEPTGDTEPASVVDQAEAACRSLLPGGQPLVDPTGGKK